MRADNYKESENEPANQCLEYNDNQNRLLFVQQQQKCRKGFSRIQHVR